MQSNTAPVILELQDLALVYTIGSLKVHALQDVRIVVRKGETVGLAGESGSGKSTLGRAVMGLLPPKTARITAGRIIIDGVDVTGYASHQWQRMRGSPIAMVFQDPLSYLNPVVRIGQQIAEGVKRHDPTSDLTCRVVELLRLVKLDPEVARRYPHELSGGMRQRVVLAIALGCRPKLLVADEPTTALDVTTQNEILALLAQLRRTLEMSLLLISHDLAVLRRVCERIYIMYGGHTVETGSTTDVFSGPCHPYTSGLVHASRLQRGQDGRFESIGGDVPALDRAFECCPFRPRCPVSLPHCGEPLPPFVEIGPGHAGRCWRLQPAPS